MFWLSVAMQEKVSYNFANFSQIQNYHYIQSQLAPNLSKFS